MSAALDLRLYPEPKHAIVFAPHLRGWLAEFAPLPELEECLGCAGTGVWDCDRCTKAGKLVEGCKACDVCQDCDGILPANRRRIAVVLDVELEHEALARALKEAHVSGPVAISADKYGDLFVGGIMAIRYRWDARDLEVERREYAHEQTILKGVK